jgi:uncharacterized protein YjbI with pentapeptide repeats
MMNTKTVGSKIAEARKRVNLSQAQLAQTLFISPQAVGKWERGESMPDIVTFHRLAEIVGVDLNYFGEGNVAFPAVEPPVEHPLAEEAAADVPFKPSSQDPSMAAPPTPKPLAWNMSQGNWVDADLSGLKNLREKFFSANLQRCKLVGSDLSGLKIANNNIETCDLTGSTLAHSQLLRSSISFTNFTDCSFLSTAASGSTLTSCDLSGADLSYTTFKMGSFAKNTTHHVNWKHTAFVAMHLEDILFEGTIDNGYFETCSFSKVTFQNATLINTFFKNSRLKRITFINCTADRMTYELLRIGKADLSGVTMLPEPE